MGVWEDFYTAIVDVSYQQRILKEAQLTKEAFEETIESAIQRLSMQEGEKIIYHNFTLYSEPRAVREYVRGFTGFRIAKGVYIGGSRGRAESHEELRVLDYGTLTITNKRLIFMGKFKSNTFKTDQIAFVNVHTDGIQVGKEGRQRGMYFSAESGLLPYFAIKNIGTYKKLESIYAYLKFFMELPDELKKIEITNEKELDSLETHSKNIEMVASNLKKRYKEMKSSDLPLLSKDIEELLDNLHSLSKTVSSVVSKASGIKSTIEKPTGILKIFKESASSQMARKFKEKFGITPQDLITPETEKINAVVKKLGNDFEVEAKSAFKKLKLGSGQVAE